MLFQNHEVSPIPVSGVHRLMLPSVDPGSRNAVHFPPNTRTLAMTEQSTVRQPETKPAQLPLPAPPQHQQQSLKLGPRHHSPPAAVQLGRAEFASEISIPPFSLHLQPPSGSSHLIPVSEPCVLPSKLSPWIHPGAHLTYLPTSKSHMQERKEDDTEKSSKESFVRKQGRLWWSHKAKTGEILSGLCISRG